MKQNIALEITLFRGLMATTLGPALLIQLDKICPNPANLMGLF
jgi:hypothetical protein